MTHDERMLAYLQQIKEADDEIALLRVQELFGYGVQIGEAAMAKRLSEILKPYLARAAYP